MPALHFISGLPRSGSTLLAGAAAAEPALRRGDDRAGRQPGHHAPERDEPAERDGGLPRRGQAQGDPAGGDRGLLRRSARRRRWCSTPTGCGAPGCRCSGRSSPRRRCSAACATSPGSWTASSGWCAATPSSRRSSSAPPTSRFAMTTSEAMLRRPSRRGRPGWVVGCGTRSGRSSTCRAGRAAPADGRARPRSRSGSRGVTPRFRQNSKDMIRLLAWLRREAEHVCAQAYEAMVAAVPRGLAAGGGRSAGMVPAFAQRGPLQ